jgi:hypothetical protein
MDRYLIYMYVNERHVWWHLTGSFIYLKSRLGGLRLVAWYTQGTSHAWLLLFEIYGTWISHWWKFHFAGKSWREEQVFSLGNWNTWRLNRFYAPCMPRAIDTLKYFNTSKGTSAGQTRHHLNDPSTACHSNPIIYVSTLSSMSIYQTFL